MDPTRALKGVNTADYATIVAGNPSWTDVKITANVRADGNSAAKLMARVQDANNYYACGLDANNQAWLGKRFDGAWYTFDELPFDHSPNRYYSITYKLVGPNFTCSITDPVTNVTVNLSGSHDTFAAGKIGCLAKGTGHFTNVVVSRLN
jgi:hypothetical protein